MRLLAPALAAVFPAAALAQEKWSIEWTDLSDANPLELNEVGDRSYMPYVLHDESWPEESRFRMWFDYASINGIAYAESADGIVWTNQTAVTGLNGEGEQTAGRAVALYGPDWEYPFRLYYYGNPGGVWQVRVAESADGINFVNDQVAISAENSQLGSFPDGHAVLRVPGQEEPYRMFYNAGSGVMMATSADGYQFIDFDFVPIPPAMQPTCAIAIGQNDYRMWSFENNTEIQYYVSSDAYNWEPWDPVDNAGGLGDAGSWNANRNYYASVVYLGGGRFMMWRGGRNGETGLYRTGAAEGYDAQLAQIAIGEWDEFSPLDDYAAEGWETYGTNRQGVLTQNEDGTVSIEDDAGDGNFYMVRDVAWLVPYTVEARFRIEEEGGDDGSGPHCTIACMLNDPFHPGSETWQPSFAMDRFGGWNLNGTDPVAEADFTQFNTVTVVCRFNEAARYELLLDPNNGGANTLMCEYGVYINRDFSEPAVTFHGTGWAGWPEADIDGRLDLGWPNPSTGVMVVDWVRWGSGEILDPDDPGEPAPVRNWSVF